MVPTFRPFVKFVALSAVAAAPLLLAACDEARTAPSAEVVRPVKTATVAYVSAGEPLAFAGTVAARSESALAFRVAGKVTERSVDVGAMVKAGTVLARLDGADYDLQKRNAVAAVTAVEADLAKARADADRYEQLRGSPSFNPAVYDQRRTGADSAVARLNQARLQVRMAENQLGYTVLRADADGVVTAVNAEPGQVLPAGQWVVKVAREGDREVIAYVPEQRLEELRQAPDIKVALWAAPDRPLRAKVREISPQADAVTRTYAVRFSLLDPAPAIQLGMTATVVIERNLPMPVAPVPLTALFQSGKEPAVWVVDRESNSISLRPVTVVAYREDAVLLAGGVKEGDIVVSAGVNKLDASQKVRLFGAGR
jgi:multidrug efflux system membrane fusion protein